MFACDSGSASKKGELTMGELNRKDEVMEKLMNSTPKPEQPLALETRIDWLERRMVHQADEIQRLKNIIRKHAHMTNGQVLVPVEL
jgi:hypothetical protein